MQILEYHVIPNQALYAANFTDNEVLKTVMNDTLKVCSHQPSYVFPAASSHTDGSTKQSVYDPGQKDAAGVTKP